jgi:hypothetical protein
MAMAVMPLAASSLDGVAGKTPPEEHLSIADLSKRIPYAQQTIRNLMSRGVFQRGVHYVKPRGRVIFKWSAVQAWLEGPREPSSPGAP